ncbi:MAG: nuclear transport factor 2 family protein [Oscillibacter sp.]|nr:nuclear transport factor 2 family protein [Oscillibacter sp.]
MQERESVIRLWFEMWLQGKDLGIDEIFTEDAVYIESWGPEYAGRKAVKHWFTEWNGRGRVAVWEIRQFFHKGSQTVVEWYFKDQMNDGTAEEFDGMTLVEWTDGGKIKFLKEFGCNLNRYNPYQHGAAPQFRDEKAKWF